MRQIFKMYWLVINLWNEYYLRCEDIIMAMVEIAYVFWHAFWSKYKQNDILCLRFAVKYFIKKGMFYDWLYV